MCKILTTEFRTVGCCNEDPKDTSWSPSAFVDRRLVAARSPRGLYAIRKQNVISKPVTGKILEMDQDPFTWHTMRKDSWAGYDEYKYSESDVLKYFEAFQTEYKTRQNFRNSPICVPI